LRIIVKNVKNVKQASRPAALALDQTRERVLGAVARHGIQALVLKGSALVEMIQSSGCWPAKVSTTIASRGGACQPLSCPAIKGLRYRAVVRITDHRTGQTQSAPMRMATA
jgi:hypothetical protein